MTGSEGLRDPMGAERKRKDKQIRVDVVGQENTKENLVLTTKEKEFFAGNQMQRPSHPLLYV